MALPAGMERYTVHGNGAVLIDVEAGDTISVRNVEGGQACELLAWDKSGVTDAGIFGEKSNSNAAGIKALLADGDDSLASLRRGLERRQVQLDQQRRFASSAAQPLPAPNRVLPLPAMAR